jgi:hypothetical protein
MEEIFYMVAMDREISRRVMGYIIIGLNEIRKRCSVDISYIEFPEYRPNLNYTCGQFKVKGNKHSINVYKAQDLITQCIMYHQYIFDQTQTFNNHTQGLQDNEIFQEVIPPSHGIYDTYGYHDIYDNYPYQDYDHDLGHNTLNDRSLSRSSNNRRSSSNRSSSRSSRSSRSNSHSTNSKRSNSRNSKRSRSTNSKRSSSRSSSRSRSPMSKIIKPSANQFSQISSDAEARANAFLNSIRNELTSNPIRNSNINSTTNNVKSIVEDPQLPQLQLPQLPEHPQLPENPGPDALRPGPDSLNHLNSQKELGYQDTENPDKIIYLENFDLSEDEYLDYEDLHGETYACF